MSRLRTRIRPPCERAARPSGGALLSLTRSCAANSTDEPGGERGALERRGPPGRDREGGAGAICLRRITVTARSGKRPTVVRSTKATGYRARGCPPALKAIERAVEIAQGKLWS